MNPISGPLAKRVRFSFPSEEEEKRSFAPPKGPMRRPPRRTVQQLIDSLKKEHELTWIQNWGTEAANCLLQQAKENQTISYLKTKLSEFPTDYEPATLVDLANRMHLIIQQQIEEPFFSNGTYKKDPELTVQYSWRLAQALAGTGDYEEALSVLQVVVKSNQPLHPNIYAFYNRLRNAVTCIKRDPSLVT